MLVVLWELYEELDSKFDESIVYNIDRVYYDDHKEFESRHLIYYKVFGSGPLAFTYTKYKFTFVAMCTIA